MYSRYYQNVEKIFLFRQARNLEIAGDFGYQEHCNNDALVNCNLTAIQDNSFKVPPGIQEQLIQYDPVRIKQEFVYSTVRPLDMCNLIKTDPSR